MGHVHVVGAGLAGLACAVRLGRQNRQVTLYEAASQAGGRCRSYYDPTLDRIIDNGNHLLLSANHTHSGPAAFAERKILWIGMDVHDLEVSAFMVDRVANAVTDALADLAPARLG